jgi:hypothetical protein
MASNPPERTTWPTAVPDSTPRLSSPFYSNEEAARFLRLSPRTLEKYRVIGGGPPFRKFGRRVLYALDDLEKWAERRVCDSTSDPAWKQPPASG